MKIPTKVGNISWTTYWSLITLGEKSLWYVAMTWAVITSLLTQIFACSIRRYGAQPNAWSIHRKDGMQEMRKQN